MRHPESQPPHAATRRRLPRAALVAALLTLAALMLGACTGGSTPPEQQGEFRYVSATPKGQVIPEQDRKPAGAVETTLLDGSAFSLSDEAGKVVFINFWGSWCAPCVSEAPLLESIYQQNQPNGVQFLGIAVKDDKDATAAFVEDHGISYPIVFDYNAKSALQIGNIPMKGLPASVVIDKQGRVAGVFLGSMLAGDINPVLSALIAEP